MDRRDVLRFVLAASAAAVEQSPLAAQPAPPTAPTAPPPFGYDSVVDRAKELAGKPHEPNTGLAPDNLRNLSYDDYRELRFRADRSLLADSGSRFRMQMFHLGFLYVRAVGLNILRDGSVFPVPYSSDLFDYGRNKFDPPLPANLGFAGFRLHYPTNEPNVFDELISFLGASYYRVLGRDQKYGLSARGLAIDTALPTGEEFPYFKEFWVETPRRNAESATVYALLDSPSVTGAYRFVVTPGTASSVEVQVTLFPRRTMRKVGFAPLSSMFFYGENQLRPATDYRPKLHDSDGLLINNGAGEWIWRPLRNPSVLGISAFLDNNTRGFGLFQRDRAFDHYQDLDLHYELRPSYWIEPIGQWGQGHVELVEIPTPDETNDNIVVYWVSRNEVKPGESISISYRLSTRTADEIGGHPGGRVVNTFHKRLMGHEAPEANDPSVRRFLIDFSGGELAYYLKAPELVEVVPSASSGTILRSFITPNPAVRGIRAVFDFKSQPNQTADIRAFLRAGEKALTETWTYPWRYEP